MAKINDPVAANKIDPVSTKKYQELSVFWLCCKKSFGLKKGFDWILFTWQAQTDFR